MEIMRYLPRKKQNAQEIMTGDYLWKHFRGLECDCMTSRSTRRLVGSDLDYAVNASKVRTDGSCTTNFTPSCSLIEDLEALEDSSLLLGT